MKYIHRELMNLIGRFECTMVQVYLYVSPLNASLASTEKVFFRMLKV